MKINDVRHPLNRLRDGAFLPVRQRASRDGGQVGAAPSG
jgi:hypothetical protein